MDFKIYFQLSSCFHVLESHKLNYKSVEDLTQLAKIHIFERFLNE